MQILSTCSTGDLNLPDLLALDQSPFSAGPGLNISSSTWRNVYLDPSLHTGIASLLGGTEQFLRRTEGRSFARVGVYGSYSLSCLPARTLATCSKLPSTFPSRHPLTYSLLLAFSQLQATGHATMTSYTMEAPFIKARSRFAAPRCRTRLCPSFFSSRTACWLTLCWPRRTTSAV